jgi:hypothetical protein
MKKEATWCWAAAFLYKFLTSEGEAHRSAKDWISHCGSSASCAEQARWTSGALVLSPAYNNTLRENPFGSHGTRFSHQLLLVGGPNRRIPLAGTILAAAGRSAALRYDNLLLRDTFYWRPRLITELRSLWAEIALTFASLDLPTPQVMARLWSRVYQFMHIQAQRAETWGSARSWGALRVVSSWTQIGR